MVYLLLGQSSIDLMLMLPAALPAMANVGVASGSRDVGKLLHRVARVDYHDRPGEVRS
jgi:hypothetical protein